MKTKKDFRERARLLKLISNSKKREEAIRKSVSEFKESNPKFNEQTFRQFVKDTEPY